MALEEIDFMAIIGEMEFSMIRIFSMDMATTMEIIFTEIISMEIIGIMAGIMAGILVETISTVIIFMEITSTETTIMEIIGMEMEEMETLASV